MTREIWKDAPGYLGLYQVSSLGCVRSLRHAGNNYSHVRSVPLLVRPKLNRHVGYYHIDLSKNGAKIRFRLNRLVCITFHGPPPFEGAEAAHLDGDASNNNEANLAWVTSKANHAHRELHGTMRRGDNHYASLLREIDVKYLRGAYSWRRGQIGEFAKKYNVHRYTITQAIFGKNWRGVTDPPPLSRARMSQYRRVQ